MAYAQRKVRFQRASLGMAVLIRPEVSEKVLTVTPLRSEVPSCFLQETAYLRTGRQPQLSHYLLP